VSGWNTVDDTAAAPYHAPHRVIRIGITASGDSSPVPCAA